MLAATISSPTPPEENISSASYSSTQNITNLGLRSTSESPELYTPLPTVAFPDDNDNSASNTSAQNIANLGLELTCSWHTVDIQLTCRTASSLFNNPLSTVNFLDGNVSSASTGSAQNIINFGLNRHFNPRDVLTIPKVPQVGPRAHKTNKRLGSAYLTWLNKWNGA